MPTLPAPRRALGLFATMLLCACLPAALISEEPAEVVADMRGSLAISTVVVSGAGTWRFQWRPYDTNNPVPSSFCSVW